MERLGTALPIPACLTPEVQMTLHQQCRPVCVTLSAYGHLGPWSGRRGFDSLVQNANGMNLAEAKAAGETRPKPLPCQANDHASGYLLAFGAMAALYRRATEGGSWHVRVGLAPTDLAIYYHHDGASIPSPGIIPIGKIKAGVEALNVPGTVTVTITPIGR
jgi:hypothetical protein